VGVINMNIAVIYGGLSSEREVSIKTGINMVNALRKKGYKADGIIINNKEDYLKLLNEEYDIIFIGLHGGEGENGTVQALLDFYDIPYVGSNMASSSIAMDKWKTKQILKNAGIPVANDKILFKNDKVDIAEIINKLGTHIVVKPNNEGSSIGLTIAKGPQELQQGINKIKNLEGNILLEQFIVGTEVTVGVIGELGRERPLPVVEIIHENEFFDYESKYVKGMSKHVIPARLPKSVIEKLQEYAVKAHIILGCKTYSRVDFIVNDEGVPIFLEINTLPGMTDTSLFPDALKSEGISYEDMMELLLIYEMKNYIKVNEKNYAEKSNRVIKRMNLFRDYLKKII
jgi:D-alanine-D-alanine ligase